VSEYTSTEAGTTVNTSDPILIDIPERIETERLLLQMPSTDDARAITDAITESLPELQRWMPWAQNGQTLTETEVFLRQSIASFVLRESLTYALTLKQDGQFVGMSSIFNFDWPVMACEIGYWLRTSRSGQGYMTEAVNELTRFAFESLAAQRVEIRCDGTNRRSAAVAERVGFTLEARLRNHRRNTQGDLADTLIYSRIPADGER
jgi:RimJ/RimL family protein N-acetyltransferase